MWFTGSPNITVGENTTISCLSDLAVLRVEWTLNADVITSSNGQQADLSFSPVQEYLHNREYSCRAVASYGILERRITISVHSKRSRSTSTMISISYTFALQFRLQFCHYRLNLWGIQLLETCMILCVWQPFRMESRVHQSLPGWIPMATQSQMFLELWLELRPLVHCHWSLASSGLLIVEGTPAEPPSSPSPFEHP